MTSVAYVNALYYLNSDLHLAGWAQHTSPDKQQAAVLSALAEIPHLLPVSSAIEEMNIQVAVHWSKLCFSFPSVILPTVLLVCTVYREEGESMCSKMGSCCVVRILKWLKI